MTDWPALPGLLTAAGVEVAEVPGWLTRGRPYTWTPRAVALHHTAGPRRGTHPSLGVIIHGRSGLPGPLAQALVGRDGVWHLVSAGYCNHAGKGNAQALRWALDGNGWRTAGRHNDTGSGNRLLYGIEIENDGVGEPWAPDLVDSVMAGAAVVQRLVDRGAGHGLEHRQYAPARKIDPAWSVNVGGRLKAAHRDLGEDDDMARLKLLKVEGSATIWVCDGVTRWPLPDRPERTELAEVWGLDPAPVMVSSELLEAIPRASHR